MLLKKLSKKAKLIAALFINIATIGVALIMTSVTISYAWFGSQRSVNPQANEIKIGADPNMMNISFELYKYDKDQRVGVKTVEGQDGFDLSLNQFDNFIRERNTHNSNILRFTIDFMGQTGTDRDLTIDISCLATSIGNDFDAGYNIEGDTSRRTYSDKTGYMYDKAVEGSESTTFMCNNISNVLVFKMIPYSYTTEEGTTLFDTESTIDETSPASIYDTATAEFNSNENGVKFVSSDTSKYTKVSFVAEDIPAATKSMVIYVEYNYNISLIDKFLTKNEVITSAGVDALTTSATINFQKDIEQFAFKAGDAE